MSGATRDETVGSSVAEFDYEIKNFKAQFSEQVKALTHRTERKLELVRDLAAFFGKQAEIESHFGQSLDKLHEKFTRPRRMSAAAAAAHAAHAILRRGGSAPHIHDEQLGAIREDENQDVDGTQLNVSTDARVEGLSHDVWNVLLEQIKKKGASRRAYSLLLGAEMKSRLEHMELQIIASSRKGMELVGAIHSDMLRIFKDLEERMKSYHVAQVSYAKSVEKYDKAQDKGQGNSKKTDKLREKLEEKQRRAVATRNDYLCALLHTNAYKQRFYKTEVNNLIDALDITFYEQFRAVFLRFCHMCSQADHDSLVAINVIREAASIVEAHKDKEHFLASNQYIFFDRYNFEFLKGTSEAMSNIQFSSDTLEESLTRYRAIEKRIFELEEEIAEAKGTLRTFGSVSGKAGALLGVSKSKADTTQELSQKPVEASVMYVETFQRLSMSNCKRAGLRQELTAIGQALGSQRPPPVLFNGRTIIQGEGDVEAVESPGLDIGARLSPPRSASQLAEATKAAPASSSQEVDDGADSSSPPSTPSSSRRLGGSTDSPRPLKRGSADSTLADSLTLMGRSSIDSVPTSKPQPTTPQLPPVPTPDYTDKTISGFRFGASLSSAIQATDGEMPLVLKSCMWWIRECCMQEEGLFRVPGSSAEVAQLKEAFEAGHNPLTPQSRFDPSAVAGCLKLYLRELDDPVMTRKLYPAFVQVSKIPAERTRLLAVRELVCGHMPDEHRRVLQELMVFLSDVAQHSAVNKMNIPNLAVVFGPTLMPAPDGDISAMLRDSQPINKLMGFILENQAIIFAPAAPAPETPQIDARQAVAKFAYAARNAQELSFKAGDVLDVFDQADANWWVGQLNGQQGFIAAAYVQLLSSADQVMAEAPSSIASSPTPMMAEEAESPEALKAVALQEYSIDFVEGSLVSPLLEPLPSSRPPPGAETWSQAPSSPTPTTRSSDHRLLSGADGFKVPPPLFPPPSAPPPGAAEDSSPAPNIPPPPQPDTPSLDEPPPLPTPLSPPPDLESPFEALSPPDAMMSPPHSFAHPPPPPSDEEDNEATNKDLHPAQEPEEPPGRSAPRTLVEPQSAAAFAPAFGEEKSAHDTTASAVTLIPPITSPKPPTSPRLKQKSVPQLAPKPAPKPAKAAPALPDTTTLVAPSFAPPLPPPPKGDDGKEFLQSPVSDIDV